MIGGLRTLVSGQFTSPNKTHFITDEGIKLDLSVYEERVEIDDSDVDKYISELNKFTEADNVLGGVLIHAGYCNE